MCTWCKNLRGDNSLCAPCLEKARMRNRARAERLRIAGLCQYCGKFPNIPGIFHCQKCKEYHFNKRQIQRKSNHALGLCVCGKPKPDPNHYWCQPCLDDQVKASHHRYTTRVAAGLCPRCGKKAQQGLKMCTGCRVKSIKASRVYNQKRRKSSP